MFAMRVYKICMKYQFLSWIIMVAEAQKLPGCYGARLTGAGFEECTMNLVEKDQMKKFSEKLALDFFE